ncbi:MAG: EAL domain-containing protein [Proteobacteria bacterium]|nr:EAL domain-containing protein [Pseudomonadota bacterium]
MQGMAGEEPMEQRSRPDSRARTPLQQLRLLQLLLQRIADLQQPLEQVLGYAADTVCTITGAAGAMLAMQGDGQLAVQVSFGETPQPPPADAHELAQSDLWRRLEQLPAGDGTDHILEMLGRGNGAVARQCVALPLRAGASLVGLMQVLAAPGKRFSPRQLVRLKILAESLGGMAQLRRVHGQSHASEQQYRGLFAEHPQPMWVCERDSLRLLLVNHAMARQYGYDAAELLGMDMRQLWPPQQQAAADSAMAMCLDERAAHSAALPPTIWHHRRKDGSPIDVEIFVGDTEFDGRPAWQMVANDVTARCRIEDELARLNRAKRLRSACSETLVRASSEADLLHAVCRAAVEVGGYRMGWVGMARDDARKRIEVVAQAGAPEGALEHLQLSWSQHESGGQGPSSICVRSGRTVIVRDAQDSPAFEGLTERLAELDFHAVVCLPLRNPRRTFGLLTLYAPRALHVGPQETLLLEAMAGDLAFGIENLRARAEQQRLQAAMVKVAKAVSAGTGRAFFERLAQHMADSLSAQVACVVRLLPPVSGQAARHAVTLSHVSDGVAQATGTYTLAGTPGQKLLDQGRLVVSDHLAQRFAHDPALAHGGLRSFVGRQLTDSAGAPIGMVMVMFREPLAQQKFVESALQIFGARASAELQRQTDDMRIRHQASLLDRARDAIIVRDLEHRITFWNEGAERLYGWSREEALGRSIATLLYPEQQGFLSATNEVLQRGDWSGEIVQQARDGRAIEVEGRWTMVRNDQGEPESILAINSDIGTRKNHEREIQRLAFFDPLTGLPNRAQFMQRMGHALATSQRQRQGGALLFIDLDNFKTLNDTLGHDQGDRLLQQVAQRLTSCVRGMDLVARLGGDEFVVLLEQLAAQPSTLAELANKVGEKILSLLCAPYALAGHQYRSTPSIGIALFGNTPTSVGELLKHADLAMYQAKTAGRSTLRFFDPGMQRSVDEHAALEADLRNALSLQEFSLHYQPQVNSEGKILGVEALLRWTHPERGMVSPAQFIPVAEETGLILPLGRWVLHQACTRLAAWHRLPGMAHLNMAVNVSSRQFRDPGFVGDVARVLAVTEAPAAQLKLELTESLLVEDMVATIATMEALRVHGVGFALDDFGTGYSSLSYLKRMPLERLKIDQSFVRDLLSDESDAVIVRTIIALAASLGLDVIAESVETEAQRNWLTQAGCRAYQGYFFSRPLPADQIEPLLRAGSAPENP